MIQKPDTLRAAGKFPITEGPVTLRSYSPLPLPSDFPTMTAIVDPYGRWIRTDGTHWDLIGVAPNVIHLDPAACVLDVGAAIVAADARLGATPGVIVVPDGGTYEWTTSAELSSNRVLMLGLGTYNLHNAGRAALFLNKTNNVYVVGRGWGTILNESDKIQTDGTGLAAVFIGFSQDSSTGNTYGDAYIGDMQLRGTGTTTTLAGGAGASAAIALSNAKRCTVENVKVIGTHYIGITTGGAAGDWGDACSVRNCYLENVQAVYVACVNASNARVQGNTFRGGPNALATAVDFEANVGSDRLQNFVISGNVFDVGEAQGSTWYGISIQGGIDVITDNPDSQPYYASDHGIIANNQFYGYRGGFNLNYAVFLSNCKDIIVANNNTKGGGSLEFQNCLRCVAHGNRQLFPSGNAWITLLNSKFCIIQNNWNLNNQENASNNQILENGTSDFNLFTDNYVSANGVTGQFPGVAQANILLSGANSREWNNYMGEPADGNARFPAGRTMDGVYEDYRGIARGDRIAFMGTTIRTKPANTDNECTLLPIQPAGGYTSYVPNPALSWGVYFSSSEHGWLRAVRFYKDPADTSTTHSINIWDNNNFGFGALQTIATSGESASGWQTAVLATPIEIKAGKMYAVAIDYDGTHQASYKNDSSYPYTRGPLTVSGAKAGGSPGNFPQTDTGPTNQPLVDVVFVTANQRAANICEHLNTTTGAEDVLTVSNPQPGNWMVGCSYRVLNGTTTVTIVATWKDASNSTQTATMVSLVACAPGTYAVPTIMLNTDSIVPGSLKVTATASVAGNLVTSASAHLV